MQKKTNCCCILQYMQLNFANNKLTVLHRCIADPLLFKIICVVLQNLSVKSKYCVWDLVTSYAKNKI